MSNLTKQAIKSAFLKLLDERPLSRITVRDISQECGINRNSFYYHYHDIPELVEEILRDDADSLVDAYFNISSLEECVEMVFRFVMKNRRSIYHIYHSVNREVFEQHLMRICGYTVDAWYASFLADSGSAIDAGAANVSASVPGTGSALISDSVPGSASLPENRQQILRFIRYELFGACVDFMNEGMPPEAIEDAKELLHLSLRLLTPERDNPSVTGLQVQ